MFPILLTPRTTLREITEVDADTIFDCFSQKEVIRYYGQEKFTTIQEALVLIDIFAENSAREIDASPSSTFAPIEVPLRSICLDNTNSFFSLENSPNSAIP